jgi:hypothetical protein
VSKKYICIVREKNEKYGVDGAMILKHLDWINLAWNREEALSLVKAVMSFHIL